MKTCENCSSLSDGSYGSGRFCSAKCARGFSTKSKRVEINEKVRIKLSGSPYPKICQHCNKYFTVSAKKKDQRFCSRQCVSAGIHVGRIVSDSTKQKISDSVKNQYFNGKKNYGGRTKWITYGNLKVQGTYEYRTCTILDNWKLNNIIRDWEYTNDRVTYVDDNGITRNYLIDFKVIPNDGLFYYLEVKGYATSNDLCKWSAVREKYKLEVWYDADIKLYEQNMT